MKIKIFRNRPVTLCECALRGSHAEGVLTESVGGEYLDRERGLSDGAKQDYSK